jgi:tRNA modification GTPase
MNEPRTFAVMLTPAGRGAVASVLVQGAGATELAGRFFAPASGRDLASFAIGRIVFGRWGGDMGEEVVVCRRSADEIEIHGHGGEAAIGAILDSLKSAGCEIVGWQEWSERKARQGGEGRFRAQALFALSQARTERTAAILLDQYQGTLSRAFENVRQAIVAGETQQAKQLIHDMLQWSQLGRHLVEPFRVVLAGRPNVGKSSLINALVGYTRALVYDQPGTTRDVVSAQTALAGWPVELSDTAGLRETTDPLEAAGVARTREQLTTADLIVLVFDASEPSSVVNDSLCRDWENSLVVHNKSDLAGQSCFICEKPPGIWTSTVTGEGIRVLEQKLAEAIVPQSPAAGAAVPFLQDHVAILKKVQIALEDENPEAALQAIDSIY